jgi:basic membrane protein A
MKKALAMGLALAFIVSSLVGCAGGAKEATNVTPTQAVKEEAPDTDTTDGEAEGSGESNTEEKVIDLSKFEDDDIGVCLVINTNLGDKSICDLSNAGLQKIGADYGVRVKCIELGGDATKQIPTFIDLAEDPDWDIIIAGTPNMRESLLEVAGDYPEQQFILYDAAVANASEGVTAEDYPNVYSMEHAQNEGSYVVGAAAAILTTSGDEKTNDEHIIGFVGGGQNTAIEDFLVGYIEGAKAIDSEIKVLISYIGSFSDSAKGKELAMAQIDQGADVVFSVAGGAGLGVLAGCAEKGVYAIGVDGDQYEILKKDDPTTAAAIATSMQKKADQTVYSCVSRALEGTLPYGTYDKVGLAGGVVGAADNENFRAIFTEEQIIQLKKIEENVAYGDVKVFSAIGADNASIQQIKDSVQ